MKRIYDNTTLSEFERCNRRGFYRHYLNWVRDQTEAPLAFGGAWHAAMDVVWSRARESDLSKVADAAYLAFCDHWMNEGMPDPDSEFDWSTLEPRTPANAAEMIFAYIKKYIDRIRQYEVIGVEVPFAIPLDENNPDILYCGKLDKVVRKDGETLVIEHKTTSMYQKSGGFKDVFTDSFDPNSQVYGYIYAGTLLYGERFKGVIVDGALVHSNKTEGAVTRFIQIPVEKSSLNSFLDAWRWETLEKIRQWEANIGAANTLGLTTDYLPAFKKNTGACFDFMRACPYLDFCKTWANPVKIAAERYKNDPPPGYTVSTWTPFENINLDALGIHKADSNWSDRSIFEQKGER